MNLLSFSYWFAAYPQPLSDFITRILWTIFAVFFVLSVIAFFRYKQLKHGLYKMQAQWYRKLANCLLSHSILFSLWLSFTYEHVSLLGSRFWFPIFTITFITWMGMLIYERTVTIPKRVKIWKEKHPEG